MSQKYDFKNKLYLITDEILLPRKIFLSRIKQACKAGIDLIQIREKKSDHYDRLEICRETVKLAHSFGAKIIINDDPLLAAACGADGVHIGKYDVGIKEARDILGQKAMIGVSCYGDVELAQRMQKSGADYVSFGNFFLSPTKPLEKIVPLDIISQAKRKLKIPVLAIGGINEKNFTQLIEKGADGVCCVSALLKTKEIKKWRIK